MQQIQSQEQWVLYRLEKFYSVPENLSKVRDILNGTSKISLRLIDWSKSQKHVVVYLSYKSHLKAYSKKMFDPFCRWKRIKFMEMDTTVGQLNFFEWAISDEVLDYLEKNREVIHADMEGRLSEIKETAKTDTKKKRHELSNSATKSLTRHDVKISVKFD
jgi:hypothetical protein